MIIVSNLNFQLPLAGLFILALTLSAECQAQPAPQETEAERDALEVAAKELLETHSDLKIEDAWYELPIWAKDLPFDLASKFAIKPEDNREQLYREAFLEFSFDGWRDFPHLRKADEKLLGRISTKILDRQTKAFDFFFKQLVREENEEYLPPLKPAELAEANRLLKPFDRGFSMLRKAQQRPECFFHSAWTPYDFAYRIPDAAVANFMMACKCYTILPQPESLNYVETALRLQRDLVQLGHPLDQSRCDAFDVRILRFVVSPILNHSELKVEQLDRLISILKEHDVESRKSDPFVEATKRELLNFRHAFYLIGNRQYYTNQRAEFFDVDEETPVIVILLRELVDQGVYRINPGVVKAEIETYAATNETIAAKWKEIQAELSDEEFEDGARMLLALFVHIDLDSVQPADLQNDIAVLDSRYRQVVEACQLPYPNSSARLQQLEQNWTTDDSWQKSKILRWFKPCRILASARHRRRLRINAFLCLAAIRKWQFEHDGESPEKLSEAMNAIGIEQVPIDTYTGKPLKMILAQNEVIVFSVGPDGDDDQAKVEYDRYNSKRLSPEEAQNGDIVFRLQPQ